MLNLTKEQLLAISKTCQTEGWGYIRKYIEDKIELLTNRILDENEADVVVYHRTKKDITVIRVDKDYYRHSIKTYQDFLRSIDEWNKPPEKEK